MRDPLLEYLNQRPMLPGEIIYHDGRGKERRFHPTSNWKSRSLIR